MPSASPQPLSFDDFLAQYSDDCRYELNGGLRIDLAPCEAHEVTIAFLEDQLDREIERSQPPTLFRPHSCILKTHLPNTALRPDVMVLDRQALDREPRLWADVPIVTKGKSIKLIAEIVSQSWQNDYVQKMADYATFGVAEYWLIDYAGLAEIEGVEGENQPIVTTCHLTSGHYNQQRFRGDEPIASKLFPDLHLTATQIWAASQAPLE